MCKPSTEQERCRVSVRASLVAIGVKLNQMGVFKPVAQNVHISQKVVKYTPPEKLLDCLITILAGARGLVEANKRVRTDRGLQAAFGRKGCAEQSVISETLDACTKENVSEMEQAMQEIYRQHSQGYRHDYAHSLPQVLDIDMTGMPCGKKAAFATKGYFAKQRNRRGRQLGRVLATHYKEIVVDRLFDGKTQLARAFQPLVKAAAVVLDLDDDKRARTVLRVDAGGGSQDDVNWALEQGYLYHGKEYSGRRARILADTVKEWIDDPKIAGRQVGWVTAPPTEYVRPVKRIAVRCRKKNGQWGVGVIISALQGDTVIQLTRQPIHCLQDPKAVLLAYVYFYDQRSGAVETEFKGDKQGLGLTKRNKKRFEAQQVVVQLGSLAHNIVVWSRNWLARTSTRLRCYGTLRMVRDVFQIKGLIVLDYANHVRKIILDEADPLADAVCTALQPDLASLQVALNLGEI